MTWRDWLGRLALPLLALPAAWGVYQFQLLFVPWFIAALAALAFETVYLGLAVAPTHSPRRAVTISAAAVIVSAVYNALASALHLRPDLLAPPLSLASVALLALLHGAPLAVLAYAVASHLLHAPLADRREPDSDPPAVTQQVQVNLLSGDSKTARVKALAVESGVSESTMWRRVKASPELLEAE